MWRWSSVLRCPQVLEIIDCKPLPNRTVSPLKSNNCVPPPPFCRNVNLFEFSAFCIFIVISGIKAIRPIGSAGIMWGIFLVQMMSNFLGVYPGTNICSADGGRKFHRNVVNHCTNDVSNQQDTTTYSFINLFKSALHVWGDKLAHPQEHFFDCIYSFWHSALPLLPTGATVEM